MEKCLNNDFEGKIIEIPGIEQDPNEFFFKYKSNFKNYIIGINLDDPKTSIIISIALKNINNIVIRKPLTYKEIENFDPEFFVPFKKDIFILFKFMTRLLLANLIDLVKDKKGNKNLYYLILNCLKNSNLKTIKIDLNNNNDAKEIIIERASEDKNNNKEIKNKTNQKYEIKLRKIEHEYENSEIYKEIEIKFTTINTIENKVYYDYLNSQEIFDREIPYYNLFNRSIEDVIDDLNIIIYHKNYYFEEHNNSIKFFFKVFNIRKSGTEPYISIFIEALNRERENYELQSKMKEYFQNIQNKLNMEQNSEKIENIDEQSEEKAKKKDRKIKKEIKNNSQMSFLKNFLNMNKDLNSNNDENENNKAIKNENDEQKMQRQSNSKYINIEKNELIRPQFIIKEPNIKNNEKNISKSNLLEKENETCKGDSRFMNQKRYIELPLDIYFEKRKKNEKNEDFILNNNENNNINNNNNLIKKSDNYSIENKEKKSKNEKEDKKEKKLNIHKSKKEGNKKSEDINTSFKLNKNLRYNIKKDEVIKAYLNVIYEHPLDKNDEYEVIKDKSGKEFYLCKICKQFFNSRYSVRKHQWIIHLKPFREIIQKDLKSEYKNKFKI